MKINFYNTPQPAAFDAALIKDKPNFIDYRPDFALMDRLTKQFEDKEHVIVVGHGGSITSSVGIYSALRSSARTQMHFVSTIDPDYIAAIKSFASKDNSLVIAISKSGETVTQIEALMQFIDYPMLIVTGVAGPLSEIAAKLNSTQVIHPPIGGRFSGFSEVGLLPIALAGINAKEIYDAGQKYLQQFQSNNPAYEAASILYQLEQQGIADVFLPIYSEELFPYSNLIIQLCHESFGKDGKGQTYFAHRAPESQHHTNQRFFGGQKNIAGWFIGDMRSDNMLVTKIPESLSNVPLKTSTLNLLDGIPLQSAMQFEREATLEDAKLQNIPVVDMMLETVDHKDVGEFMAFWQLYAVYASCMRGVDPYNQPQVEASKKISFAKRQQFKGSL
ncbi:hypothetical protein IPM19_03070 [bacterium]|nr:MAG: hypothetical protein IPM19_03070 [bacterium]